MSGDLFREKVYKSIGPLMLVLIIWGLNEYYQNFSHQSNEINNSLKTIQEATIRIEGQVNNMEDKINYNIKVDDIQDKRIERLEQKK